MEKWLVGTSIIVALLTLWGGIYQFNKASNRTAMTPFLEKQLEYYDRITEISGIISTTEDIAVYDKAVTDFWVLYYGQLSLVEDQGVEAAMVKIGTLISSRSFKLIDRNLSNSDMDELKEAALNLSKACRHSISKSWKLDLGPLEKSLIKN